MDAPTSTIKSTADLPGPIVLLALVGAWAIGQAVAAEVRHMVALEWSKGFDAGLRGARILEDMPPADSVAVPDSVPAEA